MFTNEELDLLASALNQQDRYLANLAESVPGLTQSGSIDEARGRCFLLLAKVRRSKTKPVAPAPTE